MNQLGFPILSLITFLPLVGIIILLFTPRKHESFIKNFTLLVSLVIFLISLALYFYFDDKTAQMQFVEKVPWFTNFGIYYHMGIDGISLWLVLLTTFLTVLSILSSWTAITEKVKEYYIMFLLLETGMLGVFVSLDLFLFYVFWEAMLVPMYFLIGIWGGPRRIYAAVKFFLYTMAGSVLMLLAILFLYFYNQRVTGVYTFDLLQLMSLKIPFNLQVWMFLAFALSFAIKVPIFPFHTWLPDAHVEAPTAGSVILAGVLLKMGTYGYVRFCLPLFPEATYYFIPLMSILAIIGIIYGALVSMVQPDLKKLVAYSSVSHLGFVVLGIFALNIQGLEGGILQMVNHGLSTGALFLVVGMIYERRHTRMIADFGGLAKVMPVFFAFFMVVTLSSVGLPGLNGFVGEFLILLGVFRANTAYATLGATGVILGAVYLLWMFQRVMFGECTNPKNQTLSDLNWREIATLVPIVIFIVWIGVYPKTFISKMDASVKNLVTQVQTKANRLPVPEVTMPAESEKKPAAAVPVKEH